MTGISVGGRGYIYNTHTDRDRCSWQVQHGQGVCRCSYRTVKAGCGCEVSGGIARIFKCIVTTHCGHIDGSAHKYNVSKEYKLHLKLSEKLVTHY